MLVPKIPLGSSPADAPVPDSWRGEVVLFTEAHDDQVTMSDAIVTLDSQRRLTVNSEGETVDYMLTGTTLTALDMYRILQSEKRICLEVAGNQDALPVVRLLVTDPLLRAAGKASPSLLQSCSADITEFVPKTEVKRDASA